MPIHFGIKILWTAINIATLFLLYKARLAIDSALDSREKRDLAVESVRNPNQMQSVSEQLPNSSKHPGPSTSTARSTEDIFNAYNNSFVQEVKRLAGKAATDLHWVELVDDESTRKAFHDGIDPLSLAAAFHKHALPPL